MVVLGWTCCVNLVILAGKVEGFQPTNPFNLLRKGGGLAGWVYLHNL